MLGLSHIACFNLLAFGSEAGEEITFSNSTRYVKRKEVGEEIFLFGLTGQSMGQPKGIDLMEAGRSVGRKSEDRLDSCCSDNTLCITGSVKGL